MTTDGLNALQLEYNFLNLTGEVSDSSGDPLATYTWLADGTKVGVIDDGGHGLEYTGSLIYKRNGTSLELESTSFGGGRIEVSEGTSGNIYTPNYFLTDHLGSTRTVVTPNGTVRERNDYHPFGLRWSNSGTQISDNRFRFSGKENQTTGDLPYQDFGARFFGGKLPIFTTPDPLGEKYYSWSQYNYTLGNPIKYIDPDGRDVFITGVLNNEALKQLQARAGNSITLSMGDDGKVSYTTNTDKKLRGDAKRVAGMINEKSISVNIVTTDKNVTSTGNLMVGGSFMGNTVKTDANGVVTVDARQEVNPNVLGKGDAGKTGKMMMHEVTEAYQGAKISQTSGISSPRAGINGSVYEQAHDSATPQNPVYQQLYDRKGEITTDMRQAVKAEWYVIKNKEREIIQKLQ
jgi:RHS repeat-associated protein